MSKKKKGGGEVAQVVIDNGNGNTEGIRIMPSGRHVFTSFPSLRAEVSGEDFDDDFLRSLQTQFDYADWGDSRYTYGSYCLGLRDAVIDRHQGSMRYGNPVQQCLVDIAMGKLKVQSGEKVDLTLLIPPGHFNDYADVIKTAFTRVERDEESGKIVFDAKKRVVQLRGDKNPRKFRLASVTVRPELVGALLCFSIDQQGKLIDDNELEGVVWGIDGGMHTLDILEMRAGAFNINNLHEATIADRGIHTQILRVVLRKVRSLSRHFESLTEEHLDAILRKGMETGGLFSDTADWTLHYGVTVDLQPLFKTASMKYAEWIGNNVIDTSKMQGLKGVDLLILFGGFAELVSPFLKKWYDADRVRVINEFASTSDVTPISANMMGYGRLAMVPEEVLQDLQRS